MSEGYQPISKIDEEGDKYIYVNGDYIPCTVEPPQTPIPRKSVAGKQLSLYQCNTKEEISDQSGFWIHEDCLDGNKIRENTFPESDERESFNGKDINIDGEKSKDGYKLVTNSVNRTKFLRQKEDIFKEKVETSASIELEAEEEASTKEKECFDPICT